MSVEKFPIVDSLDATRVHRFIERAYALDNRPIDTREIKMNDIGETEQEMLYFGAIALFPKTPTASGTLEDFREAFLPYNHIEPLARDPFKAYESLLLLPEGTNPEQSEQISEEKRQTNVYAKLNNQPVIAIQIGYSQKTNKVGARIFYRSSYTLSQSLSLIRQIAERRALLQAPYN